MNIKKRALIVNNVLKKLYKKISPSLHFTYDFELLAAVILSASCTDKRVNMVTKFLFAKYKNISDFANANEEELAKIIYSTGFYQAKTRYIVNSARKIIKDFQGSVPDNMTDLLSLPGVARKTANVVLYHLYSINLGIAVDTHVKRLVKVYKLSEGNNAYKIEKDLMSLVPREDWGDFSLRLIYYGRDFCPAKKHNHSKCPITVALKGSLS